MRPNCIRVDADQRDTKLDPMSRVHFGRIYTIEHGVKARSFGRVNRDSMNHLMFQWQAVLLEGRVTTSSLPTATTIESRAAAVSQARKQKKIAEDSEDSEDEDSNLDSEEDDDESENEQSGSRARQLQQRKLQSMKDALLTDAGYRVLLAEHSSNMYLVQRDPRYHALLRRYQQ